MEIQPNEDAPLTSDQAKAEWDRMAAASGSGDNTPAPVETPPQIDQQAELDPWADVPEIVRQKLAGLDQLDQRVRSTEGRVGALQRDVSEAKSIAQQMRNAPTQQQISDASASQGKWKALMEDYPEFADAFEERLSADKGVSPDIIQKLEQQNQVLEQQAQTQEKRIAMLTVEIHHPGWEQTVQSEAFKAWREKQPAHVEALGGSGNPSDAIEMLNLFKGGKNRADEVLEQRQKRLQASANPQQRQTGRPPNSISEDGLTDREIWDLEANKRAAERKQQRQFERY